MIIKQPNGLYCVYSNIVNGFTAFNLTKEQLFVELLSDQIMVIIRMIERVDSKGVEPDLSKMITKAKKQQKDDMEFLENFEKTYDQPVLQENEESVKNIVENIQVYLEECDSVLLKEFRDFFDNKR